MPDAAGGRRVLVLAPFPPRLDGRHGGSRAVAQLVVALARRDRVALAYLRATDEPPADPAVTAACERVHEGRRPGVAGSAVRPWPRALAVLPRLAAGWPLWAAARRDAAFAGAVRELAAGWRPHVAQAEFTALAPYLREVGPPARRVVTVHEPGVPAARERVAASRGAARLFWRSDLRRWARFERRAVADADAAVVFSDADRRAVEALGTRTPVARIPLAVPIPEAPLDPAGAEPPRLLFVGSVVHPPNLDAALHLVDALLPRLRARVPGVALDLVGEGPPDALRERAGDGVTVAGWVPELTLWLDRAAVVVAPLRLGGGMRVKVAEALAAGKAVAGSPLAFAGLDVRPGVHALVAEGDEAFVDGVAALLLDRERRAAMGRTARAFAVERLGPVRTADAYDALYRSLGI